MTCSVGWGRGLDVEAPELRRWQGIEPSRERPHGRRSARIGTGLVDVGATEPVAHAAQAFFEITETVRASPSRNQRVITTTPGVNAEQLAVGVGGQRCRPVDVSVRVATGRGPGHRSHRRAASTRLRLRLCHDGSLSTHVAEVINFYSTGHAYGEFSNFAPYPISLRKKQWPTSEHYFQAQKFEGKADQDEIRRAKSPMLAAEMGRDRKRKLRRDWESAKVDVMLEAVMAKFTQHAELRELLLSTGDARLVENTGNDDYWGDGGDGSGKNMLGRILMEVRVRLRKGAA